jgi:DNA polymerase III epsilon subunit-like protein
MTYYAVIDTETTGFGKHDRIIEIAVVVLDPVSMETIDEFDT